MAQKFGTRNMTCKYCHAQWTIRDRVEDLQWYVNCCKSCWQDDAPGMARYERMAAMMGTTFAIDHS